MNDNKHLLRYEEKLTELLVGQCRTKGFIEEQLLEVEELDEKWNEVAPEYMVDAVPEINAYPAVAIAWAAYIGMGMAAMWDGDWEEYKDRKDLYKAFREPHGFDMMDEYVMKEFLGVDLDSAENKSIEDLLRGCAHTAMAMIRNENFEAQGADAFYVFARTAKVFFKVGVSIELKELGYSYKRIQVDVPKNTVS